MKKGLLILIFLLFNQFVFAQQWYSLQGGLSGNDAQNNKVTALCTDTINNVLYVGGYFNQCHADTGIVPVLNIAKWDGTNWSQILFHFDSVTTVIGFGQVITSMVFHGTEIYFTISNSVSSTFGIVKFDVNTLFFTTIGYFNNTLNTLCFYHDSLYVGGKFTQWKPYFSSSWLNGARAMKWQGGAQWQQVGTGISGGAVPEVHALCVHHNKLYAAGIFENAGGTYCKNIACWNDTSWSAVGSGIGFSGDFGVILFALESYHNKLFAGGDFYTSSSGFATGLAFWDDTNWSATQISPIAVYDLKSIDNKLYLAANWAGIGTAGPWGFISIFNDTTWAVPYKGPRNEVYAIEKFDSDIYAGGKFIGLNDTTICGYVARYDATIIQDTTGVNQLTVNGKQLTIYPNPFNDGFVVSGLEFRVGDVIEIRDMLGRKMIEEKIDETSNQIYFKTEYINAGIYLCVLRMKNGGVSYAKIVKQ